jgi:hypothetical protein
MSMIRRWATFRGERCLAAVIGPVPYTVGEELILGTRAYVVTRVLRAGRGSSTTQRSWEIWGRRRNRAEVVKDRRFVGEVT